MNRGQVPQGPALVRPRREVVTNGDCAALARLFSGARHVGPTAGMTGFASIGAPRSGRGARADAVIRPIDGDGGAVAVQRTERVFIDVPFDTGAMHPPVDSNHGPAARGSRFRLDELRPDRSESRVSLGRVPIQTDMRQEISGGGPRCTKSMSITEGRNAGDGT